MSDGGSDDFEEFFRALYPQARRLAFRILASTVEAEDAAAEAFARALASWRKVGDLPHRDAWVLRVTTNVAVDIARRRPRIEAAGLTTGGEQLTIEDAAVLHVALVAALAALPRRQREVVSLRYLVGMDSEEVARSLGVSLGSVKRHGHRAIQRLRRFEADAWNGEGIGGIGVSGTG